LTYNFLSYIIGLISTNQKQNDITGTSTGVTRQMSTRYQFVLERAEGLDNYMIADKLHLPLDIIDEVECDIEDEFLS
jgi:DNA-binding NarL/FixJ family response regulator